MSFVCFVSMPSEKNSLKNLEPHFFSVELRVLFSVSDFEYCYTVMNQFIEKSDNSVYWFLIRRFFESRA